MVQTDASNRAVGGVLAQYIEGQLRPIAFVSRKLLPREINYSTIEKETLAIIFTVQKLRSYLIGQHFQLQTDHSPLECLSRMSSNQRLIRWSLLLSSFSFSISHIKGKLNVVADSLSRQWKN